MPEAHAAGEGSALRNRYAAACPRRTRPAGGCRVMAVLPYLRCRRTSRESRTASPIRLNPMIVMIKISAAG